jgi:hypothetical protein
VKRTRRVEPIGVVMHICMETTQGNCWCRDLYLKLPETSCFSFYLLSSMKAEKRRVEQVKEVSGTTGRGKVTRKGVRG